MISAPIDRAHLRISKRAEIPPLAAAALLALTAAAWGTALWAMSALHHAPGLWPLFAMWAPMMVAMMLPPETPALLRVERPAAVVAGYLLPWVAFSLAAAALQLGLEQAGLLNHHTGALENPLAAALLLIAAGALQLTPLKRACLDRCRAGPDGSFRGGLRASGLSIASCGVLMLAPLAVGVMNPWAMGLLTALLVAERLAPGRWPIGAISAASLLAGGIAVIAV